MVQIDIKKIIASKNPKLAKRLPNFMFRFIRRILHIDQCNYYLKNLANGTGQENVKSLLNWLKITYTVHGLENVPKNSRLLFASNHPLGALDGIILLDVINDNIGEPRFLVNDLLLHLKVFDPLFVPINSYGPPTKEIAQKLNQAFSSDCQIIIFPSGLASRKIKGKIIDLKWKKSFVQKSIEYQRDIIPVFFKGSNSKFFYRLENIRKFLRIKINFGMFLLPREMFRNTGSHFDIYFGNPVSYNELKNSKNELQWTEDIRKMVYSLQPS